MGKIRFCRRCYDYGKVYDLLADMIKLVQHGKWECPYMKPQCGREVGAEN